jgi:hypothetical protein
MQTTVTFGTFPSGEKQLSDRINEFLRKHSDLELVAIHNVVADKIGGPAHEVLAVFEPTATSQIRKAFEPKGT